MSSPLDGLKGVILGSLIMFFILGGVCFTVGYMIYKTHNQSGIVITNLSKTPCMIEVNGLQVRLEWKETWTKE